MGKYSPNIIANCLNSLTAHNPEGEALVYGTKKVSWAELAARSKKIAQALIGLGVKKGDKVVFMFHNTPEFIEINGGIQVAGAVPVPMNYRFTPREIEFQAGHSDSRVFIYDSRWAEAVEKAAPRLGGIKHFIRLGPGELDKAIAYEEFLASAPAKDPRVHTSLDDPAVMIYTGGTTGFPKGVLLSYRAHVEMFAALLSNVVTRAGDLELDPEQMSQIGDGLPFPMVKKLMPLARTGRAKSLLNRPGTNRAVHKALVHVLTHPEAARVGYKSTIKYMLPSMPFFHDASYQVIMLAAMMGNICFVLHDKVKFDPRSVLEMVGREKPIFMANVPAGWKKLVSFAGRDDFDTSSLRIAATGAGAASVGLKKKIFEAFPGIVIIDMFGQTEMTPITAFRIDADASTLKERSVGKSIVEVKVVDEAGKEAPRGESGEILYRSGTVMMGYYKDDDKTKETMVDGWFRSGDLGYIDEDGEVRLIDRMKECINTGGEKVFPLEVEEIIHEHPAVDDVCVIGVPDEEWGSVVRAVVRKKPGAALDAAEIVEFCRDKIAGYKIPKSVVFVDELPLSPVGKVLRQKIRELHGNPE